MSKYTTAFKLKVVLSYLSSTQGYHALANHLNLSSSQVRLWVGLYQKHGIKGLTKHSQVYTQAFKLKVVKTMIKNQLSVHATAVQFNLPSLSTPLSWLKYYNHSGHPYPIKRKRKMPQSKIKRILKTPNDELSHQDLLEKLSYIEAENAYLKKAEAFVQEQALKTKKKRNGSLN